MGYDIGEIYKSNSDFLKADDIGGNFWTVTVNAVDQKEFDDGSRKLHISFAELDKGLVLNKTNADMIGDLYGKNTDGWMGKQVMLFTAPVDYQGKKVQAIRVRAPAQQQPMPTRASPQGNGYQQASGGNPVYSDTNPPPITENPLS